MRMVFVEEDDGLAQCLIDHFGGRHWIRRSESLDEAIRVLREEGADLLFADLSAAGENPADRIREIRRIRPGSYVVLTHLESFSNGAEEEEIREAAHLVLRKPYDLVAVDRAVRDLSGPS